jgi:hypothetical protein
MENDFVDRILNRIGSISKEIKRAWTDDLQEPNPEVPNVSADFQLIKKQSSDDGRKKIVKKKGVGYASDNTGQNQKWNP